MMNTAFNYFVAALGVICLVESSSNIRRLESVNRNVHLNSADSRMHSTTLRTSERIQTNVLSHPQIQTDNNSNFHNDNINTVGVNNIDVQIISPADGLKTSQSRRRTDEVTADKYFFLSNTLFQDDPKENKTLEPKIDKDKLKRVKKSIDTIQQILETKISSTDKMDGMDDDDIETTRKKDKKKVSKKHVDQVLVSSAPSDTPSSSGSQSPSIALLLTTKKKLDTSSSPSPSPASTTEQPTLECKSEKGMKMKKKKKKKKSEDFNPSDSPSASPTVAPNDSITHTATPIVCKMSKGMMGMMKGMTKGKSFKDQYPSISPRSSIVPFNVDKGSKKTKEPKSTKAPSSSKMDPPVDSSTRQPSSITNIPTITASPTTETFAPSAGPLTVRLSQRTISYTIERSRIPFTSETMTVENITINYLTSYFLNIYSDMEDFTVSMNTSRFNLMGPYEIDYDSIAIFPSVMTRRTSDALDQSFQDAFSPPQGMIYLTELQELPSTNIFSTVTDINVSIASQTIRLNINDNTQKSVASKKTAFLSAMGASAFVVILVGIVCFQRRSDKPIQFKKIKTLNFFTQDQDTICAKNNTKSTIKTTTAKFSRLYASRRKIGSHFTVAGDTYTGDGTVWSGSGTYTNETKYNDEENEQQQLKKTVVLVNENPYLEEDDDDNSSFGGTSLYTTTHDNTIDDSQQRGVLSTIVTDSELILDVLQVQTNLDDNNDTYKGDDNLNTSSNDDDEGTGAVEDGLLQPETILENDDDNDIQEVREKPFAQQLSFWNKAKTPSPISPLLSPRKSDSLSSSTFNCTTPVQQEQGSYWKRGTRTRMYPNLPSPTNSSENVNGSHDQTELRFKLDDTICNDSSLDVPSLVGKDDRTSIFVASTDEYRPIKVSEMVKKFTANR